MLNLSWKEISDLKHHLIDCAEKAKNLGFENDKRFFYSFIDYINELVEKHEEDSDV